MSVSEIFEETRKRVLEQKRFVLDSKVYTIRDVYPGSTGIIIRGLYVERGLLHSQIICVDDQRVDAFLKGEKVPYSIFVEQQDWKQVFLEQQKEKEEQ